MKTAKVFRIATAVAALAASTGSFATVLVVRAAGPSAKVYPPGKALPESAKIQLQTGDSVMLLNTSGAKTLRGPGTFAVASSGETLADAANRRARFSAMRGSETPLNPSPWNVDVTQSGKLCVANPAKLTLWRPEKDDAIKVTITGGGGEQTIDWPAGKDTVAWPASLPVSAGAEYEISQPDTGDMARVTFVTLANPPADTISTAQSLIANGCDNQLDVLVDGAPSAN